MCWLTSTGIVCHAELSPLRGAVERGAAFFGPRRTGTELGRQPLTSSPSSRRARGIDCPLVRDRSLNTPADERFPGACGSMHDKIQRCHRESSRRDHQRCDSQPPHAPGHPLRCSKSLLADLERTLLPGDPLLFSLLALSPRALLIGREGVGTHRRITVGRPACKFRRRIVRSIVVSHGPFLGDLLSAPGSGSLPAGVRCYLDSPSG